MGQGQNAVTQIPQAPSTGIPDLARLLGSVSTPAQVPTYAPAPQPAYSNPYHNPALAAFLGSQQQPAPAAPQAQAPTQPNQPDMSEIMAQLAKYQR